MRDIVWILLLNQVIHSTKSVAEEFFEQRPNILTQTIFVLPWTSRIMPAMAEQPIYTSQVLQGTFFEQQQ